MHGHGVHNVLSARRSGNDVRSVPGRLLKMYELKTKIEVRPILKWAGGKTQLLPALASHIPRHFDRYIEPFVGGGALFFSLQPAHAILSDRNPELVNLYVQVAADVDSVIAHLRRYENSKEMFYAVREQDWTGLPPSEAAARMIYLNRTCFNGLYRVNRAGEFNVPFGNYQNPVICDESNLRAASRVLKNAEIFCCDFADVLDNMVRQGDFVFLDPPYLPIGKWGDFKRYTKEQFHDDDHRRLSMSVAGLREKGVWTVLTNSNHPLARELYADYQTEVVKTRRNVSSNGTRRTGEDLIVDIRPDKALLSELYVSSKIPAQVCRYPRTRFMGSKQKLIHDIWKVAERFNFESALDLFSGSGVVGYLFKAMGKSVICNDYMAMAATFSKAMIENNVVTLGEEKARSLLCGDGNEDLFVSNTFKGLFFTDEDNHVIDVLRANIMKLRNPYERAIAKAALIRACSKKRPRGLFTYVGHRYDDGRKDLRLSFGSQFLECVRAVNQAVFDNGRQNRSRWGNALGMKGDTADLVYIDPPYFTPKSDNEYVRRYHFLEGLARDWKGVEIQQDTKTKKFKNYPTPFSTRGGAAKAFGTLFSRFRDSLLMVSYSSNSLPTKEEIVDMLKKCKQHVDVVPIDYRYNFGNRSDCRVIRQNVLEYIFVGY